MLRRAGAKADVLKLAELFRCRACNDTMRAKHPRPSRYAGDCSFNVSVISDVFTVLDVDGRPRRTLNILREGTCFQVVAYIGPGISVPSSRFVLNAFLSSWASWAGMPQRIWTDRGKEFVG